MSVRLHLPNLLDVLDLEEEGPTRKIGHPDVVDPHCMEERATECIDDIRVSLPCRYPDPSISKVDIEM